MAEMSDRILWSRKRHESNVEKFYGKGAENFADFHGGYLNFGLWEKGYDDYLSAAEHLTSVMGKKLCLDKKSFLLDVGFGHGAQDVYLYDEFGCKITGLDVTWQHVANARERVRRTGINKKVKNIIFHHGTAVNIPFDAEMFTHLLSIEAPEHFNTREMFLKEAYRVLKPGGKMALADFVLKRQPKSLWETFVVHAARILWCVPKANWTDVKGYGTQLEKTGFKKVKIEEYGALTIPGYYEETSKKENLEQTRKIRGWFAAYPGHVIDYAVYKAFKSGLIEYIIVRAEK